MVRLAAKLTDWYHTDFQPCAPCRDFKMWVLVMVWFTEWCCADWKMQLFIIVDSCMCSLGIHPAAKQWIFCTLLTWMMTSMIPRIICQTAATEAVKKVGRWMSAKMEAGDAGLWGGSLPLLSYGDLGATAENFFANIGENLCNNTVHFGAKYAF